MKLLNFSLIMNHEDCYMPPINKYRCNSCDFSFPDGWGGYFYVEVDEELIRNRIRELDDQLSNLNRNFAKIKGCMTETERACRSL
jgi:hypothetical protein